MVGLMEDRQLRSLHTRGAKITRCCVCLGFVRNWDWYSNADVPSEKQILYCPGTAFRGGQRRRLTARHKGHGQRPCTISAF